MDRVVDVLWNSLVWWLVLTADSQPHIAFVALDKPAVTFDHVGKVGDKENGGKKNEKWDRVGGRTLHVAILEKKVIRAQMVK